MPTVYAVASGKGGVGKTTTTAALGSVLAAAGHGVVAVDCDLGMPNLAPALGVDDGAPGLHEVLAGEASLADAIRESPVGVDVVPGSRDIDSYRDSDPAEISDVVDLLVEAGGYDYVLLDTGAGLSHDNVLPLSVADAVLLVSTVDRDALGDAERTREVGARVGGYAAGVVLTRVREDQDTGIAEQIVEAPVLGEVPEDPEAAGALAVGTPLPAFAPRSAAAAAYRALAAGLTGEDIPDPPAEDREAVDDGAGERDGSGVETGDDAVETERHAEPGAATESATSPGDADGGAAIPDAEGGTAADAVDPADAPEVDLAGVEVPSDDRGGSSSPLAGAMAEAEAMAEADDGSGDGEATAADDSEGGAAAAAAADADGATEGAAAAGAEDVEAGDADGANGVGADDANENVDAESAIDEDGADGDADEPGVHETPLAGGDDSDGGTTSDDAGNAGTDDRDDGSDDGKRKGFFSRLFG